MKALFNISNYKNINITPEISFSDVMDGTPDTMSFSFIYNEDLSSKIKLKSLATVILEDDVHNIEKLNNSYIDLQNNLININGEEYIIDGQSIFKSLSEISGYLYSDEDGFVIEDNRYLYKGEDVYLDNRLYYYMCLSQISSELLSTSADNGYLITVNLKEQTVLLKDCIKSDIAISPDLYPKLDLDEDGIGESYVYPTLLEAVYKICDRHNMHLLNFKIQSVDSELETELSKVVCPNLTYKDLSTFDQLYDIFIRIGKVPYFENGKLYGLSLEGDSKGKRIVDVTNKISSYSSYKEENINQNVYSTKVYNNLYDNEIVTVPSYFASGQREATEWVSTSPAGYNEEEAQLWLQKQYKNWTLLNSTTDTNTKRLLSISNYNSKAENVEDSRSYSIDLPSNIEEIISIYRCKPVVQSQGSGENIRYQFGFSKEPIGQSIYIGDIFLTDIDNGFKFPDMELTVDGYDIKYKGLTVTKLQNIFFLEGQMYRIVDDVVYNKLGEFVSNIASDRSFYITNRFGASVQYYLVTVYDPVKYFAIKQVPTNTSNDAIVLNSFYYRPLYSEIESPGFYYLQTSVSPTRYYFKFPKGKVATINNNNEFSISTTSGTYNYRLSGATIFPEGASSSSWVLDYNSSTTITAGTLTLQIYVLGDTVYTDFYTPYILVDSENNSFVLKDERTYEWLSLPDSRGNGGTLGVKGVNQPVTTTVNWQFQLDYSQYYNPYAEPYTVYNLPNIIEYSIWSKLETLQQRLTAYYTRGESQIKQAVSLVADKEFLQGSFSWSDSRLYNALKSSYYIVEYKPMLNQEYINYDYNLVYDGLENIPSDINSYNLPFKSVSDKQVYPTLSYNLDKGLDYSTQIKIVTKDKSILDLSSGGYLAFRGKLYVIQSLQYYINDKSIEVTISMSNKVIINSILSTYKDSVRVSSNLSTEDTVDAIFPILSEQIISLSSSPNEDYIDDSISDNDYFTQELGKSFVEGSYYQLDMNPAFQNKPPETLITKYPLRFTSLVNKNAVSTNEDDRYYDYYISLNGGEPYQSESLFFTNFPIYYRKAYTVKRQFGASVTIDNYETVYDEVKSITSYKELLDLNDKEFILEARGYWLFGKVIEGYTWYEFSEDETTWVSLRPKYQRFGYQGVLGVPSGWDWNPLIGGKAVHSPYKIFAVYTGLDEDYDTNQVYCTEGFLTNSGRISSYQYLINNSSSLLTRYYPSADTRYSQYIQEATENQNTPVFFNYEDALGQTIWDTFSSSDPVFFNKSDIGCRILGFGPTSNPNWNLSILPSMTSTNYSTIIDMRETPSAYLQYKVIHRDNDNNLKIISLSDDIIWASSAPQSNIPIIQNVKPILIKISKLTQLSKLDISSENLNDYLVDVDLIQNYNGYVLSDTIYKDEDNNYVLCYLNESTGEVRKAIEFNVENGIDEFYIDIQIRNSYDTISHNI